MSQSKQLHFKRLRMATVVSACAALASGLVLRIWMLNKLFEVNGDSELYGSMARSLLRFGRYAVNDQTGALHATLIRLPGYPLLSCRVLPPLRHRKLLCPLLPAGGG